MEQRKKRHPQKIGDVISQLMARRGYARVLSEGQCAEVWKEVVGSDSVRRTRTGRMRRGVLEIVVDHPVVLQELNFRKRQLIQELNQKMPELRVRDLKFIVGQVG